MTALTISAAAGGIQIPPAPPPTMMARSPSSTMKGLIEERGRFPGSGWFGVPGGEKSVSSLFRMNPAPGATTALPKKVSTVQVKAAALPAASITETCDVVDGAAAGGGSSAV